MQPAEVEPRAALEQLAASAGVPKRYRGMTLDRWRGLEHLERLSEDLARWRAGELEILYVYGEVGTGKTHLATGLFLEQLAAGSPGLWLDSCEWTVALREAVDLDMRRQPSRDAYSMEVVRPTGPSRVAALRAQLRQEGVVQLDDLGTEHVTPFTRSELAHGINQRFLDCQRLLITSNMSHAELREFSPRIASRLLGRECGSVGLTGKDRREPAE